MARRSLPVLFGTTQFGSVLILWLILPLIPLAIWSFAQGWRFPNLLPNAWTMEGWAYALSGTSGVRDALWLSLWIGVCTTILAALIGIPAGRALGLYTFRGKAVVELVILAPIIVPGIAVALGIQGVFVGLGLTNSVTGVVLVHLIPTLPYMTLVMAGIFANFDPAYEQQARSLGASRAQTFRHVTLPAILPGIVVGGLFAFLVSWSQYILTLVIGGGRVVTLPLLLYSFVTSGRHDIAGAISMIYILPGTVIVIVSARYLSGRNRAVAVLGPT